MTPRILSCILVTCTLAAPASANNRRTAHELQPASKAERFSRAIRTPSRSIGIPALKKANPVRGGLDDVWAHPGTESVVYRLSLSGKPDVAHKIFFNKETGRKNRFNAIIRHLRAKLPNVGRGLEFNEDGFTAGTEHFDELAAEYIDAPTLDRFVADAVTSGDTSALGSLPGRFLTMSAAMTDAEFGHGDLSHSNLLVPAGAAPLEPVDFSNAFTPELEGMKSVGLGHENYRHPRRTENDFDLTIDNFSAFVIYASLRALATDPGLFTRFHDGRNLILRRRDFEQPSLSEALRAMEQSQDAEVRRLASALRVLSRTKPGLIPALRDVVDPTTGTLIENKLEDAVAVLEKDAEPEAAPAVIVGSASQPIPEVSSDNPALFIGLEDGSGSMFFNPLQGGDGSSKAHYTASIMNGTLNEMMEKNREGLEPKPRIKVGLAIYSGQTHPLARSLLPGGARLLTLPELYRQAQVVEIPTDGETVSRRFWLEPHQGIRGIPDTPMRAGLEYVYDTLVQELADGGRSRLVIVLHTTDGRFNVPDSRFGGPGDPTPIFQRITDLVKGRGHYLLLGNIHLSHLTGGTAVCPTTHRGLDGFGQMLFNNSSIWPAELLEIGRRAGIPIQDGARFFGFNAGVDGLMNFIEMGTQAALVD